MTVNIRKLLMRKNKDSNMKILLNNKFIMFKKGGDLIRGLRGVWERIGERRCFRVHIVNIRMGN